MSQSMLVLVLFGAGAFSATANSGEVASCSGGEAEARRTIITQDGDDKDAETSENSPDRAAKWYQLQEKMERNSWKRGRRLDGSDAEEVEFIDEEKALEMRGVNQMLKAALKSGKVRDLVQATWSAETGLHTASSYEGYESATAALKAARAEVIAMLKDAVAAKDVEELKTAVKSAEDAKMRLDTEHYVEAMELLSELKGETPYTCSYCLYHVRNTLSDETKEECLDDDTKLKCMRNAIAKVASGPSTGGCAAGCEKRIPDADIIKF